MYLTRKNSIGVRLEIYKFDILTMNTNKSARANSVPIGRAAVNGVKEKKILINFLYHVLFKDNIVMFRCG